MAPFWQGSPIRSVRGKAFASRGSKPKCPTAWLLTSIHYNISAAGVNRGAAPEGSIFPAVDALDWDTIRRTIASIDPRLGWRFYLGSDRDYDKETRSTLTRWNVAVYTWGRDLIGASTKITTKSIDPRS